MRSLKALLLSAKAHQTTISRSYSTIKPWEREFPIEPRPAEPSELTREDRKKMVEYKNDKSPEANKKSTEKSSEEMLSEELNTTSLKQ